MPEKFQVVFCFQAVNVRKKCFTTLLPARKGLRKPLRKPAQIQAVA
jgi:hypothetical protein